MPILLNKPVSKTPLEMIEEYRKGHPDLEDEKIGYAGRLDPMAEGLLLLLVDDETKERETYEALEKEYEFTILFGMETDTYDLMGVLTSTIPGAEVSVSIEDMRENSELFVRTFEQKYPPYSSAAIKGKPLYWWSRQGRLNEIDIPKKKVTVKEFEIKGFRKITAKEVAETAIERVEKAHGDFRQEEIVSQWRIVAERQNQEVYVLADCRVVCSSGTYIRGLCHSLGQTLKTPALAYSIKRTKIGKYNLKDLTA